MGRLKVLLLSLVAVVLLAGAVPTAKAQVIVIGHRHHRHYHHRYHHRYHR